VKLESGKYRGKKDDLNNDFNEVIRKYNSEARGERKADILTEFMNNITPIMLSLDNDNGEKSQK
jgi:uncharacterized protein YbcI